MKRSFMLLIVMVFVLALAGCNEKEEKVNVDFRLGEILSIVKVDKGSTLTNDILPLDDVTNVDLYYDNKQSEKYNDEPINGDLTIYVKYEKAKK